MNRNDAASSTLHATLTDRRRPEPAGAGRNTLAFGWRALLKIKHVPEQLFDAVIDPRGGSPREG